MGAMLGMLTLFARVFGVTCILIGLSHVALGPDIIPGGVPVNATMDSEDRFFGTIFAGFGGAALWCSFALADRVREILALMALFFLGGIARLISVALAGWPGDFILALIALELVIPPLFWVLLRRSLPQRQPPLQ